jgi:hypothetical protein
MKLDNEKMLKEYNLSKFTFNFNKGSYLRNLCVSNILEIMGRNQAMFNPAREFPML